MEAEVVVRIQDDGPKVGKDGQPQSSTLTLVVNGTPPYPIEDLPEQVIVRAEEVLIVVLVLMIWVAAIALFFNRWGKIRMLEPYQPKFQQQHRGSCPMGDSVMSPQVSVQSESERLIQRMKPQRMSFSKYNVNCDNPLYSNFPSPNPLRRPRQNSVFVGSTVAVMNPPRRAKSAMDIQHLVDYSPSSLSGCSSFLPMISTSKRPSITIETPQCSRHRQSVVLDDPIESLKSRPRPSRNFRRPSCLETKRPVLSRFGRHRHFISFDQPTTSWDRRTSITIERPSNRFDQPSTSKEQPLIIEPPLTLEEHQEDLTESCPGTVDLMQCNPSTSGMRRPSFHLETPSPNRHRLSVSLDQATIRSLRSKSPVSSSLDETKIQITNFQDYIQISDV